MMKDEIQVILPGAPICVIFWEKVPLVAENKAEINPIISRSVMIYAFWRSIYGIFKTFISIRLLVEKKL